MAPKIIPEMRPNLYPPPPPIPRPSTGHPCTAAPTTGPALMDQRPPPPPAKPPAEPVERRQPAQGDTAGGGGKFQYEWEPRAPAAVQPRTAATATASGTIAASFRAGRVSEWLEEEELVTGRQINVEQLAPDMCHPLQPAPHGQRWVFWGHYYIHPMFTFIYGLEPDPAPPAPPAPPPAAEAATATPSAHAATTAPPAAAAEDAATAAPTAAAATSQQQEFWGQRRFVQQELQQLQEQPGMDCQHDI